MNDLIFKHGWIKDKVDERDLLYKAPLHMRAALPARINLRNIMPPVFDQGSLGSCVGNGVASNIAACVLLQTNGKGLFIPSRLMIYYMARELEGTVNEDSGCMIRDAIKSVVKNGVCPESQWEYDIDMFAMKPTEDCYQHAQLHQVIKYERIMVDLLDIKACLASASPVVFGAVLYNSFMSKRVMETGDVPYPSFWERLRRPIGGHCMVLTGYDDAKQVFMVKNSWGTSVGDQGYFTMPYRYIGNKSFCSDMWKITLVEQDEQKGEVK